MIKADDRVDFGEMEQAAYTHFEELQKRVEQLQNIVNMHAEILRQNNFNIVQTIKAPMFDEDALYLELADSVVEEVVVNDKKVK